MERHDLNRFGFVECVQGSLLDGNSSIWTQSWILRFTFFGYCSVKHIDVSLFNFHVEFVAISTVKIDSCDPCQFRSYFNWLNKFVFFLNDKFLTRGIFLCKFEILVCLFGESIMIQLNLSCVTNCFFESTQLMNGRYILGHQ